MHRISLFMTLTCLSLLSLVGCGAVEKAREAAKRTQLSNDLKMLGLAYLTCHDSNQKGPADWPEAQKFGLSADSQQRIEAAGYTIVWGLKTADAKQGISNTIAAYPANAASEGGMILLLDGAVQQLTGAEVTEKLGGSQ